MSIEFIFSDTDTPKDVKKQNLPLEPIFRQATIQGGDYWPAKDPDLIALDFELNAHLPHTIPKVVDILDSFPFIAFATKTAAVGFIAAATSLLKQWLKNQATRTVVIIAGSREIRLTGASDISEAITALESISKKLPASRKPRKSTRTPRAKKKIKRI
jgi:hypothetical protein